MAKNPGRGNKIFRRNSIPNLVGVNKTTAESTLTGLGFNYNTTNENTSDSNLNNTIKSQNIAPGTVEELGQMVNLVNYTFSFTPFGAFGFTPFGFTPFSFTPVFSFTPFAAFGFTPWAGPSGNCIHEDTLIKTESGDVPAKEIQVGDKILSFNILEIPLEDVQSSDWDWRNIAIPNLTIVDSVETTVTQIIPSEKQEIVYFNSQNDKKYSLTQPMFIKDSPYYFIKESGSVQIGDVLIKIDNNQIFEEVVYSINIEEGQTTVYQFSCEPQDWFIAGNYLVHNK
jgi:hypothetical protein